MATTALTSEAEGLEFRRLLTDERSRGIIFQLAVALGLLAFIVFIVANTLANLEKAGLEPGYGFLNDPAFFDINQRLIEYTSQSTFGRALVVGFLNTILVSSLGIIAAALIGFSAGVLRLSNNWILSRLVTTYVEFTRNVPVLLQIIFWWAILTGLPKVRDSLSIGDALFSASCRCTSMKSSAISQPKPMASP